MMTEPWQELVTVPLKLQIAQHEFEIPREYSAGHVCDAGEAQVLNQTLIENIRNNARPWVMRVVNASLGRVLSAEDHASLQAKIAAYVATYTFKVRERTRDLSPLESATSELARRLAESDGQRHGFPHDSPETFALYIKYCADPAVIQRAREVIIQRQRVLEAVEDTI